MAGNPYKHQSIAPLEGKNKRDIRYEYSDAPQHQMRLGAQLQTKKYQANNSMNRPTTNRYSVSISVNQSNQHRNLRPPPTHPPARCHQYASSQTMRVPGHPTPQATRANSQGNIRPPSQYPPLSTPRRKLTQSGIQQCHQLNLATQFTGTQTKHTGSLQNTKNTGDITGVFSGRILFCPQNFRFSKSCKIITNQLI